MKPYRVIVPAVLLFLTLATLGAMYERMLWDECRGAGHSFLYCLHVISR